MGQSQIRELIACIDRIRPSDAHDRVLVQQCIEAELLHLRSNAAYASSLGDIVKCLLLQPGQYNFYAEVGMRSSLGFTLEALHRIQDKLLPPPIDYKRWEDLLMLVFHQPDDHIWVDAIDTSLWFEFLTLLNITTTDFSLIESEQLHALCLLSYRLVSIALDQEIIRFNADIEQPHSPMLLQNEMMLSLINQKRNAIRSITSDEISSVKMTLQDCTKTIKLARKRAKTDGISIRTTYLLARASQIIDRIHLLLDASTAPDKRFAAVHLVSTLLYEAKKGEPLSHFISDNVSLLSQNITDHASQHGEHYIANDLFHWKKMFKSAALGGVIIAFMALIKLQISMLHLPYLTEGLFFGLDYGLGFVFIHLLGGVVATKQPAMTAANIADHVKEGMRNLDALLPLIKNTTSSQFIAVLGNVGVAAPLAFLLILIPKLLGEYHLAATPKVISLLTANNPLQSPVIWYAAIAGVGLFLSGLVSGFFDNRARYLQLALRLNQASFLNSLPKTSRQRLASFVDEHYGAIAGNLFFGFYLGLAYTLGSITGLPLDIRHIAFSSANIGLASAELGWKNIEYLLLPSVFGVILIGIINLWVSFSFALWVALRSRGLGFKPFVYLGRAIIKDFFKHPLSYFNPPSST